MDFGNLAIFQRYFMSDPDGTYALLDYLVQGTTAPTPDTLSHGGPISLAGPGPPKDVKTALQSRIYDLPNIDH